MWHWKWHHDFIVENTCIAFVDLPKHAHTNGLIKSEFLIVCLWFFRSSQMLKYIAGIFKTYERLRKLCTYWMHVAAALAKCFLSACLCILWRVVVVLHAGANVSLCEPNLAGSHLRRWSWTVTSETEKLCCSVSLVPSRPRDPVRISATTTATLQRQGCYSEP